MLKISLARLSEIHDKEETQQEAHQTHIIPKDADIVIKDLSIAI
jgi:ATP-binding cassette subfamily B protein